MGRPGRPGLLPGSCRPGSAQVHPRQAGLFRRFLQIDLNERCQTGLTASIRSRDIEPGLQQGIEATCPSQSCCHPAAHVVDFKTSPITPGHARPVNVREYPGYNQAVGNQYALAVSADVNRNRSWFAHTSSSSRFTTRKTLSIFLPTMASTNSTRTFSPQQTAQGASPFKNGLHLPVPR